MAGTQTPDVSVILATRNRAAILADCLHSLAEQRADVPYEVVIVDNGSTDGTWDALTAWCRADPRFSCVREPDAGRSRALNAGIRRAAGKLLLFADDDTLAAPGWIDAYWQWSRQNSGGMVIAGGPIVPTPDDLGPWPGWMSASAVGDLPGVQWGAQGVLHPTRHVWGANMAVPADVFARLGLWDPILGHRGDDRGTYEDIEYQDRVRAAGGSVWYCPEAVIYHRVPRASLTPSNLARRAFVRGGNDYWRGTVDGVTRRVPLLAGLLAYGCQLLRWLWWSVRFRGRAHHLTFDRVRNAAWRSGWWMERLTAVRHPAWNLVGFTSGGRLDIIVRGVRRLGWLANAWALRLLANTPGR